MSGDALRGKYGSDQCCYFRSMTGSRRVKRAGEETVEETEWRMKEQGGARRTGGLLIVRMWKKRLHRDFKI